MADTSEDKARYRLLDTTRAYAHAKLDAAGEVDATARKHALYYAELLDLFKARNRKLGEFGAEHIANARTGLEWCFSAAGDAELAVRLANGSTRLFREFSLLGECWQWCDRALRILPKSMRDTYWELNLHASIGYCLMFTQGNSEQTSTAFEKGLTIAQALGDYFYQFRLLAGLHMYYRRQGEFGRLLAIARRAETIAPALEEPTAIVGANVMLGISHHLAGDQAAAHAALSASLEHLPNPYSFVTNYLGFHQDRKMVLARTLWLQGFPDRAIALMHEAEADEPPDPVTGCLTLIWGTSLLLWTGDLAKAEGGVERLIQRAGENSLQPYKMVGVGFRGDLLVRRSDTAAGLGLLRKSLKTLRAGRYELFAPCLECAMAEGLAALGQLDLALAQSAETIAAIGSDGNVYNAPELLRVHGEVLMKAGDERAAERAFRDSLGLADRQGALSLRLRSATSLARLLSRQSRPAERGQSWQKPMPDSAKASIRPTSRPQTTCLPSSSGRRRADLRPDLPVGDRDQASSQQLLQLFHAARLPAAPAIPLQRNVGAGFLAGMEREVPFIAHPKPVKIGAVPERRLCQGRFPGCRRSGEQDRTDHERPSRRHEDLPDPVQAGRASTALPAIAKVTGSAARGSTDR